MTTHGPVVCLTIDTWCLEQSAADAAELRALTKDGLVSMPVIVEEI